MDDEYSITIIEIAFPQKKVLSIRYENFETCRQILVDRLFEAYGSRLHHLIIKGRSIDEPIGQMHSAIDVFVYLLQSDREME